MVRARAAARSQGNEKIEEIFEKLESQAGHWLKNAHQWLDQGEDLVGKGKEWLEAHPVSRDIAAKVAGAFTNEGFPRSMDEARERMEDMRERIKEGAASSMRTVRERPIDTVLVGSALFLLAAVIVKNR
jgi:hypothetical protein